MSDLSAINKNEHPGRPADALLTMILGENFFGSVSNSPSSGVGQGNSLPSNPIF